MMLKFSIPAMVSAASYDPVSMPTSLSPQPITQKKSLGIRQPSSTYRAASAPMMAIFFPSSAIGRMLPPPPRTVNACAPYQNWCAATIRKNPSCGRGLPETRAAGCGRAAHRGVLPRLRRDSIVTVVRTGFPGAIAIVGPCEPLALEGGSMSARRSPLHRLLYAIAASLATAVIAGPLAHGQGRPEPGRRVSLVVVITVDQMRGDYFARYASQYTGGLAHIAKQGALFPRAVQDHANTETAPGHSTILSGREPSHTGIVSNDRGVSDPLSPLVDYAGPAASPARFNGTTLVDWLHASDARSRVLSVSRKDRGAILPVGRAKAPVFWWTNGAFTTSRYYADTLPAWVKAFNDRKSAEALAGATWDLLLPASSYAEPDSMFFENNGADFTFPHALPTSPDAMRAQLLSYPWMDSVTMAFALDGADAMELGRRGATDVLAVSLSTLDQIGHAFGPDSRELHDHLLRLDRWLGTFLDSLARLVPAERTVFVLTGDHGIASFPEYTAMVKHKAGSRSEEHTSE